MNFLDNKGGVVAIFLLITLPLFIILLIVMPDLARFHEGVNAQLKNAVIHATRTSASAVDKRSQAVGDPKIDPDRAHEFFVRVLKDTLGLDENLESLDASRTEGQARYYFVVFNGPNDYVPSGKYFIFDGNELNSGEINFTDSQQTFYIQDEQISLVSGEIEVVLTRPGTVSVVTIGSKPIYRNREEATRWAAARIEKKNY